MNSGLPGSPLKRQRSGGPQRVAVVEERAAAHGFSKDQLDRAKKKMGIVAFKEGGKLDGKWYWALPQHAPQPEEDGGQAP
jgi:hypothetical protein